MNKVIEVIAAASYRILRPLVRILLRHGVAYGTFAEWVKKAYVDAAFEELKRTGQKGTVTNVSAITGLTRKESKRLNELKSNDNTLLDARYNRSVRVISGWLEDPDFCDSPGPSENLNVLSLNSDVKGSFPDLVKRYSGDMTPVAMLDILSAARCVEVQDGCVRLVNHAYIPGGDSSSVDKLNILGADVSELVDTIAHNLYAENDELFFQRKVSNTSLARDQLDNFKLLSARKSQALLEELHHWLVQHEVPDESSQEADKTYVSVGIYYSEYQPKLQNSSEKEGIL